MIRERKAPAGPRTDFSSSAYAGLGIRDMRDGGHGENHASSLGARPRPSVQQQEDDVSASTLDHSLFAWEAGSSVASSDFLPSPSFDDMQSSIASGDDGVHAHRTVHPKPGSTTDKPRVSMDSLSISTNGSTGSGGARGALGPRPARTGSLLRRQSTSARQNSLSSNASTRSGSMDPPSAPIAVRNRRQSQHPPVSTHNATHAMNRNSRKSIGPGVVDMENPARRARPPISTSVSSNSLADLESSSSRINIPLVPSFMEGARALTVSRAAKTKSLQPASRPAQASLTLNTHTPEHLRTLGAGKQRGGNTPNSASSSSKRSSIMPGHATGLGARTISPTDTRRAKRLSMAGSLPPPHAHPPLPNTPITPRDLEVSSSEIRSSSRSPSMLPRRIATPASSRTTPEVHRKSSNQSLVGTATGQHTLRSSVATLQPHVPPGPPVSKLPTPKVRNVHSSAGDHDAEDVPPVPAIPKAYESPKEPLTEFSFSTGPSRLQTGTMHTEIASSTSTNNFWQSVPRLDPHMQDRDVEPVENALPPAKLAASFRPDIGSNRQLTSAKKNAQSDRLPPLFLMPLGTSYRAKETDLATPTSSQRVVTPPSRNYTRTPISPMTASKASFFSRKRSEDQLDLNTMMRATTSIKQLRSPSPPLPTSQSPHHTRQPISPFLSSSVPKEEASHLEFTRARTTDAFLHAWDRPTPDSESHMEPLPEPRSSRLTGPRAHKLTKPRPPTAHDTSPDEVQPPPTSTSLRRKLSLGWKRSASKASLSHNTTPNMASLESELPPPPPKHDNMPPPKLPASATARHAGTVTESPDASIITPNFLDSKRRKSSTSSLSVFTHDRTRSDSWGLSRSPKKESTPELENHKSSRPSLHKMAKRPSAMSLRSKDPWTVALDKDDMHAEEEMKKLASKKKDVEQAAREVDALTKRATSKEPHTMQQAIQNLPLNIYERGEVIDYENIYFSGVPGAKKHVGSVSSNNLNFGYDDERGDYQIVKGDHLSYRYEIVDVLGKGSFGQVVRCIDHKKGNLVAVKIIRNKKRFHAQALVEVNILKKLREWVKFSRIDCLSS